MASYRIVHVKAHTRKQKKKDSKSTKYFKVTQSKSAKKYRSKG